MSRRGRNDQPQAARRSYAQVPKDMTETRVIKKYPNRRLYDTEISSYITLEDVKRLVLEQVSFQVIDARSKEDITRGILLQIITEQEEQGNPMFSSEALAHIIRFYGDTLQGLIGRFLEQSLDMFVEQEQGVKERMGKLGSIQKKGFNPLALMSDMAEQNLSVWKSMQESFYKRAMEQMGGGDSKAADADKAKKESSKT